MSLQWTIVAAFLYAEMAVVVFLMLPFISVTVWQKLFKSRFLKSLAAYSNFYFMAFFFVLLLLFLDSLRQMQKYSIARSAESDHGHLDAELQQSMKMFRAQRNCYIAGFALFLAPVIRRICTLISRQAMLIASSEATLKQAQSASAVAEKLMKEKEKWEKKGGEGEDSETLKEYEDNLRDLKLKLEKAEKELVSTVKNLDAMKQQAEGTNAEYDRLLQEHEKLQKIVESAAKSDGDKKGI